jgi:hypothetical protein
VDGWTVGWEKSTKVCVRRKGRGKFKFECEWEMGEVEGKKEKKEDGERDGVMD